MFLIVRYHRQVIPIANIQKERIAMFDFFKMDVHSNYAEQLLNNSLLNFDFICEYIDDKKVIKLTPDGFIHYYARINGFLINIWKHPFKHRRIDIKGSFHKSFEGGTNFKDFTFDNFKTAVQKLSELLQISPDEMDVHFFETGVNILPPIETAKLIEGLKSLSGKKFERKTFNGKGLLFAFDFSQFQLKIYDKYRQFKDLPNGPIEPILRIELKVQKMQFVKSKGANLTTLQDFTSGEWNPFLLEKILQQWDNVILCPEGYINPELIINTRTRNNFKNGLNPDYWVTLRKCNSKAYYKQSHRFKELCQQFAPMDLYNAIHDLIKHKWNILSTAPENVQKVISYPYIDCNIHPFTDSLPIDKRICKSCGRDISIQNNKSKFCTAKYVGEPAAHRCRNMESNPRNYHRRKQYKLYPGATLFPVFIHY